MPIGKLDRWESRNSAMWLAADGRVTAVYSKRHLVPFSEYVPFKRGWPWLYRLLRKCVPAEMPQLAPGPEIVRFELPRPGGEAPWRLASPICFEGTFARVCRKMVMQDGAKSVDMLVNMSNDGWFVWPGRDIPEESNEHTQHLVQYCFRAIENRVPVIRAVNTGISASIDSNGMLRSVLRNHPDPGLLLGSGQTLIPGTLLLGDHSDDQRALLSVRGPQILVDRRVSPYSIIGDAFAMAVTLAACLLAAWVIRKSRTNNTEVQTK